MKLSQLIKKLQSIEAKYGDIDVVKPSNTPYLIQYLDVTAKSFKVATPKTEPKLAIDL